MNNWFRKLGWATIEEAAETRALPLWKVAVRFIQSPAEGRRAWQERSRVVRTLRAKGSE
jgi:hypothetical protein